MATIHNLGLRGYPAPHRPIDRKASMTRPLRVVAVSGGMQRPSKAAALAEHLMDLIAQEVPCEQHLVELGHQDALIDKPVLLAATGGSERHALVIDHQLRPLFSFFQARTLPLGVYATDKDFVDYRLQSADLIRRAELAVQRALPLVELTRHARSAPAEELIAV